MRTTIRSGFLFAFFLTALGAGGYWYHIAESKCHIPLAYDIGDVDSRFKISREEIRTALSDAESLWEDATGKNLFTYTPGASFHVQFVYDDRQDVTTKEGAARQTLDSKQRTSEQVHAEYLRMVAAHEKLKQDYANQTSLYETQLATYNAEVTRTNAKGGASPEEFARLGEQKHALTQKQESLNTMARDMNKLVDSINELGQKGNTAVEEYNQQVAWYNNLFGHSREFTQGDYQGNHINIYQFDTPAELRNVLAHELGHALSLQHVKDPKAIMYYLMEEQSATSSMVTPDDLVEFARVCGK